MIQQTIAVSETIGQHDSVISRYLFDAHYRLAQLYDEEGDSDLFREHTRSAVAVSDRLLAEDHRNAEWRRLGAFADMLRGRVAFGQKQWSDALPPFQRAARTSKELAESERDATDSLWAEYAGAKSWIGRVQIRLGQHRLAREAYEAEHDVLTRLVASDPKRISTVLRLAGCENNLAAWYIRQKTPDDDRTAESWLQKAYEHAASLESVSPRAVAGILGAVQDNREILQRRAAKRSESGQSGSSPGPTSAGSSSSSR